MRLDLYQETIATPIGSAIVLSDRDGQVRALDWSDHRERMQRLLIRHYGRDGYRLQTATAASRAGRALTAYFKGEVDAFAGLQVATAGTAFQRDVWAALRTIRPGQTLSYSRLALAIDRPSAVRAVGLANGANPIAILIPCHRVIGANQSLTGYAGGLERKRWLLDHESAGTARRMPSPSQQSGRDQVSSPVLDTSHGRGRPPGPASAEADLH